MSRQWGIRAPGDRKVVCKGCGVEFYTRNKKKTFHSQKCAHAYDLRQQSRSDKAKVYRLRQASSLAHASGPAGPFAAAIDPDVWRADDPYARVEDEILGAQDGTADVLRLLSRGIVWAKRAECDWPERWEDELILRVRSMVAKKCGVSEVDFLGRFKVEPRLPHVQVIKVENGFAESVTPPVCDFCGDIGPEWEYACDDFYIEEIPSPFGGRCWASTGEFLACRECAELIDRKSKASLLVRAAFVLHSDERMLEQSSLIMQGFFDHMTGEKKPFG